MKRFLLTAALFPLTFQHAATAQIAGAPLAKTARVPNSTQSAAFLDFAQAAQAIGATTKRLQKAALAQTYFAKLSDADLQIATRFFGGQTFPGQDARTVNIGSALLISALASAANVEENALKARLVKLGDPGDVAFEVLAKSPNVLREKHWSLADVQQFLGALADTAGSGAKKQLLAQEFARAQPLEAKYLARMLANDLRIGFKESGVEDALARQFDVTTTQVQRANMLLGDLGETALLARQKALDSARMQLFHPLKSMLASPTSGLDDVAKQMPEKFAVEDKFDGIRGQAHIEIAPDGSVRVALFSRTLDDITPSFPDLIEPLKMLVAGGAPGDGLILDGEILPVDATDGHILPFQTLQKRLGRKTVSAQMLQETPAAFMAYDCLYAKRQVLLEESFEKRRQVLAALPFEGKRARLAASKVFSGIAQLDAEFEAARARGNEGLIVKDLRSPYSPGRRGKEWLKIKRALATLDVVVTSVEVGSGKRATELSDYTFAVRTSETDATLLNIGKVASGLTDAEVTELSQWFREHTRQELAHGKARVVDPQIVLEVTFDLVQQSARYQSGYALRFPRIVRLRPDKPVSEIDTLDSVKKLAAEK